METSATATLGLGWKNEGMAKPWSPSVIHVHGMDKAMARLGWGSLARSFRGVRG